MSNITLPRPLPTSPHAARIGAHFGPDNHPSQPPLPARLVGLCFTNRCGSNYLAELLAATGAVNLAAEVLHFESVIPISTQSNISSLRKYLASMMSWNAIGGNYVTKLATAFLPALETAGLLDDALAGAAFIHITRRDRLGQAISFEIADQTGRWASYQSPSDRQPRFSRYRIERIMANLAADDAYLGKFFTLNNIVPLSIVYEDVLADPLAAVARVLEFLGLPWSAPDQTKIRTERQSDALNEQWREMMLAGG